MLSPFEKQDEHWSTWISRKTHRTHFLRPGTSSPANNSELLFNGSAEARQIVVDAMGNLLDYPEDYSFEILVSVLNHLKGKDLSPDRFSYTANFFGPTPEEWIEQMAAVPTEEKPELVQIAPLTFPDKACGPVDTAVFDDVNGHEYPEWSPNALKRS